MKKSQYFKRLSFYTFEWFQHKLISKAELNSLLSHLKDREKEYKPDQYSLYKQIVTLLYSLGILLILAGGFCDS